MDEWKQEEWTRFRVVDWGYKKPRTILWTCANGKVYVIQGSRWMRFKCWLRRLFPRRFDF